MKKVLKGWLIDNAVTTDNKTDKILLLASAGSLTLDDVLEEMYKQDTGLRPETMRHSVTLYHRIVMDLILNGYSVNTGLFRAVPQLKGVVEGGVWNKENNSIYVSFTQDKALREAIAKTKLTDDQITINNPSSLTLLLPADLAEGEYTLTVTTQYSNSYTLKVPRSISTPIWIGGKPADGGGDSESPDEV